MTPMGDLEIQSVFRRLLDNQREVSGNILHLHTQRVGAGVGKEGPKLNTKNTDGSLDSNQIEFG